ncbi:MAG: hypothetical protein RL266_969 [Bacteroidota bacterium]|jgi:predicted metal-dependent HD superfamily phosphohydrolase
MDHEGAIKYILERLESELPEHLLYHGHHHTIDVLEAVERIARQECIDEKGINLLLVAAAYHDCGFIRSHLDHEETGCAIARETLPRFEFTHESIESICQMIMATKVPQRPTGLLSDILCDADLDYLGRDDFKPIARNLFLELRHLNIVSDEEKWNRIQLNFLKQHFYHTEYGRTMRQPQKDLHVEELAEIVKGYDL